MPRKFPRIPENFTKTFYYSALTSLEVIYLVDPHRIARELEDTGLAAYLVGDRAVVSFHYQEYVGHFPSGSGITKEVEVCVVACPYSLFPAVGDVDLSELLLGDEQTKHAGSYRLFVPCDDDLAIAAGTAKFGEPKFKASFRTRVPSLNDDLVRSWDVACADAAGREIFGCSVDVSRLDAIRSNASPYTFYGRLGNQLISSRWNIFQPIETYLLGPDDATRVALTFGDSEHRMRRMMQEILHDVPAAAVRTTRPPPAGAQGRAFYVDDEAAPGQ